MQEPTFRPALRDVPWYVALGTLGIGISQSLVFVGNHLVGAAYAPIMVPTTPVYVALLSAAFGMEAFNRYKARRCVMHTVGAPTLDPRTVSVVSVAYSMPMQLCRGIGYGQGFGTASWRDVLAASTGINSKRL